MKLSTNVDLEKLLINIQSHDDRRLKNSESPRQAPIYPKLVPLLTKLMEAGKDRPFLRYYNPEAHRRGGRISRDRRLGISCHVLRHHCISMMRAAGISHAVIQRTVSHTPSTMTAHYRVVSLDLIREAISSIP